MQVGAIQIGHDYATDAIKTNIGFIDPDDFAAIECNHKCFDTAAGRTRHRIDSTDVIAVENLYSATQQVSVGL